MTRKGREIGRINANILVSSKDHTSMGKGNKDVEREQKNNMETNTAKD